MLFFLVAVCHPSGFSILFGLNSSLACMRLSTVRGAARQAATGLPAWSEAASEQGPSVSHHVQLIHHHAAQLPCNVLFVFPPFSCFLSYPSAGCYGWMHETVHIEACRQTSSHSLAVPVRSSSTPCQGACKIPAVHSRVQLCPACIAGVLSSTAREEDELKMPRHIATDAQGRSRSVIAAVIQQAHDHSRQAEQHCWTSWLSAMQ